MAWNGVVRLTAILFVVLLVSAVMGCQPNRVDVPDVAGMPRADAEAAIIAAGLLAGEVTEAFSDTVPTGCVISQFPKAGTKLNRGASVGLTISLGPEARPEGEPEEGESPEGETLEGEAPEGEGETLEGEQEGESPEGEASEGEGETVEGEEEGEPLEGEAETEGEGEPGTVMPELLGLTLNEAEVLIADAGLNLGVVSEAYNDAVPATHIFEQSPAAGTTMELGEYVDLTLSLGREPLVYASFNADPVNGHAPLTVQFQDTSTSTVDDINQWLWTFGDGEESTEQHPEHVYAVPGSYSVSLTVTTTATDTDTASAEDFVLVLETEEGVIGPAGGSVVSPQGASYAVAPGMLAYDVTAHIGDTPEEGVRQDLASEVPYQGAVSVFIEDPGNKSAITAKVDGYYATVSVPLTEPMTPGAQLDVYLRGESFGEWQFLDEQAIVGAGGASAEFLTDKAGMFFVRAPDAYSVPQSTIPVMQPSDAPFSATLNKVPNGGNGPIPIILIHGQNSYKRGNYGHWDRFIEWAQGAGKAQMSRYQLWWFKHYTDYPIGFNEGQPNAADYRPNSAWEFDQQLAAARGRVTDRFPSAAETPFILIGHSRGGLVARTWMQNVDGAAAQVITALTLATPHHGSSLAVPDWNYHNIRQNYALPVPCPPVFTVCTPFWLCEKFLVWTTATFEWNQPGPADLAWDNYDSTSMTEVFGFGIPYEKDFPLDTIVAGVPESEHTVSANDAGWPHANETDTDLHLPSLYKNKGRGYTLWDLAQDDKAPRFFNKAILYGGYYRSPGAGIPDYNASEWTDSAKLRIAGSFMAKKKSRGTSAPIYAANDGLVALQSALALAGTDDNEPLYNLLNGKIVKPLQIKDLGGRLPVPASRVRYTEFADYNHEDMVIGKNGRDNTLFEYIAMDLNRVAPGTITPGEMITVPAGAFQMGDPWNEGDNGERPVHSVYLDAYQIGKYEVTNREYADVLNWANAQGYLTNSSGGAYTGGLIYAYGMRIADTQASSEYSQITYNSGVFAVRSRAGYNGRSFSMENHPVVQVSWYGAVAYCTWLSQQQGLEPCYNMIYFTRYEPLRNGYRLPTEAEWERAAAWDGSRHWRYGMSSDTIDITGANFYDGSLNVPYANPLGLQSYPYTSPVGWFNGLNAARISVPVTLTENSPSPVGAYDMSGNAWEWCHDWWYRVYTTQPVTNPTGPMSGSYQLLRGGSWYDDDRDCRTASRYYWGNPSGLFLNLGFRISRTP